jgi:hypothetical protein
MFSQLKKHEEKGRSRIKTHATRSIVCIEETIQVTGLNSSVKCMT